MRYRVTVRGQGVELRGYVDRDNPNQLMRLFADDLDDEGVVVVASVADADYDPFPEIDMLREAAGSKERLLDALTVMDEAMAAMPEQYRYSKDAQTLWMDAYAAAHIAVTAKQKPAPTLRSTMRDAMLPHDFESESEMDMGENGPCAVCGQPRSAPAHG